MWKNRKRGYTIRKKQVIDLTKKELIKLREMIDAELGDRVDWKAEMEKERDKHLGR